MSIRFGPAGNSAAFYDAGHKATAEAFRWLHAQGLNAYEYACGRGVRLSEKLTEQIRREAAAYAVKVSLHAPYYISLASADPEKRANSVSYIVASARAVWQMGGDRIVVHPGGLNGLERRQAMELAAQTLAQAQSALTEAGLEQVHICPETMGKVGQLGTLEEVLTLCESDSRWIPCLDFGHLNARTQGGMNTREAYAAALDAVRTRLGEERAHGFHMHFSKIAYGAGGEVKHLTFDDTQYGPDPQPLLTLLAERQLSPTVICESAGTQAADACQLRDGYLAAQQGR